MEPLNIPDEQLEEFIAILKAGLKKTDSSPEVEETLTEWIDQAEEYIKDN